MFLKGFFYSAAAVLLLPALSFMADAQTDAPVLPLDMPVSFSGSYGELRGGHFHQGYDFKVGGKVGDPVRAIMDGYISVISVSQGGFGNAVYVKHKDGTVSIYGHLDHYKPEIARLVRKEQYAKENYRVLLYFGPGEFPVKAGDVIGYAGSTGASGGPHLHLEIHDKDNVPINYIERGYYPITDNLAPVFHKINFYSYKDVNGIPETSFIRGFNSPQNVTATLQMPDRFYVGIDATDRQNGTSNKLAVEIYTVRLDTSLIFRFKVGEIPTAEGRSIKSLREYDANLHGGRDMVKSYVEPGNALASRIECSDSGIIVLRDTLVHKLTVSAEDQYGNSSSVRFNVKRSSSPAAAPSEGFSAGSTGSSGDTWRSAMVWNVPNVFMEQGLTLSLPAAALYRSIMFEASCDRMAVNPAANVWSPVWKIGSPANPLSTPITLGIAAEIPDSLHKRALIVALGGNGDPEPVGGRWANGAVTAKVSSFGTYYVAVDTVPPKISFSFKEDAKITTGSRLYVYTSDDFSGMADYRVEIDGKWALTTFRRGRITVILDASRYTRNVTHEISVSAVDRAGNRTVSVGRFVW